MSYTCALDEALDKGLNAAHGSYNDIASRHDVLEKWGQRQRIFGAETLEYNYLGIFLSAELAFVVMALREYAYGVLKLSEASIMGGKAPTKA